MIDRAIFEGDCLVFQNGIMATELKNDGHLNYQFIPNEELTDNQIQNALETNYQLDFCYSTEDITHHEGLYDFEQLDPDEIFQMIGSKGYENNKEESKARTNLLMQYALRTLMPNSNMDEVMPSSIDNASLYIHTPEGIRDRHPYITLLIMLVGLQHAYPMDISLMTREDEHKELIRIKESRLNVVNNEVKNPPNINMIRMKILAKKREHLIVCTHNRTKREVFEPQGKTIYHLNQLPKITEYNKDYMGRHLMVFRVDNYYKYSTHSGEKKELDFISSYAHNDAFKSACIRNLLKNVKVDVPLPKTVKDDTKAMIHGYKDVYHFIHHRIRPNIGSPLCIELDHLYQLYQMDDATNATNYTPKRMSKKEFKDELSYMGKNVHVIKRLDISSVEEINDALDVNKRLHQDTSVMAKERAQFKEIYNSLIQERQSRLHEFYKQVIDYDKGQIHLSKVSRTRKTVVVIIPENNYFNGKYINDDDIKELKRSIRSNKKAFLKLQLKDFSENIEHIKNEDYESLSLGINPKTFDK